VGKLNDSDSKYPKPSPKSFHAWLACILPLLLSPPHWVAAGRPRPKQATLPHRQRMKRGGGKRGRLLWAGPGDGPERQSRLAKANSTELRRHFWQLTAALLAPFAPYLQPVLPPEGSGPLPAGKAPHPPAFSHREFLDSLNRTTFAPILVDRFTSQVLLLPSLPPTPNLSSSHLLPQPLLAPAPFQALLLPPLSLPHPPNCFPKHHTH
jgi:hypothetical protein